mgnify:CR=1 FL=1
MYTNVAIPTATLTIIGSHSNQVTPIHVIPTVVVLSESIIYSPAHSILSNSDFISE